MGAAAASMGGWAGGGLVRAGGESARREFICEGRREMGC